LLPLREAVPVTATEETAGLGLAGVSLEDPEQAMAAMKNANRNARFSMSSAPLRDEGDRIN
jgi:hypothetical protein